jgi:amidase
MPTQRYESWAGLGVHFGITRSVRDAARLLDVLSGPEAGATSLPAPGKNEFSEAIRRRPRQLTVGRLVTPPGVDVDPDCGSAVEFAAVTCAELGHKVRDLRLDLDFAGLYRAIATIVAVQTLRTLEDHADKTGEPYTIDKLERITWVIAQSGWAVAGVEYAKAREVLDFAARRLASQMQGIDLLLSPTLAKPPVPLGELLLSNPDIDEFIRSASSFSPFTSLANATGLPAMSVPLWWTKNDLPVGVMFLGGYAREGELLALARQLEIECPWTWRRPRGLQKGA